MHKVESEESTKPNLISESSLSKIEKEESSDDEENEHENDGEDEEGKNTNSKIDCKTNTNNDTRNIQTFSSKTKAQLDVKETEQKTESESKNIYQQIKQESHLKYQVENNSKNSEEESSSDDEPETKIIKADQPKNIISNLKEQNSSSSSEEDNEEKDDDLIESRQEAVESQTEASKPIKSRMNIIDSYINRPKEEIKPKDMNTVLAEKRDSKVDSLKKTVNNVPNLQIKDKQQTLSKSSKEENQEDSESNSLNSNRLESERNSTIDNSSSKDENNTSESLRNRSTKPLVPKQPKIKKKKAKKQHIEEDQNVIDYSHIYSSFYDIFNSYIQNPKYFDPSVTLRETRNLYSSYISLMDSNILFAAPQFKFDAAPLEKTYYDYAVPNHYVMTGKNLNDMELEVKNRDNDMLRQAYTQAQLKERYMKLKKMDEESIVQENIEKIKQELKKNELIDLDKEPTLFFRVIKNRQEVYDIITRAFARKRRWNELPHGLDLRNSWNFLWSWSKIRIDISKLLVWQKWNHFPQSRQMCRKDNLKKNIERAIKLSPTWQRNFSIIPETYILPKEYIAFIESFSEKEEDEGLLNLWISKPVALSRGRGITVINDITMVNYGEPIIIQRYLKNPMLINGFKFDLRIYVLVTSFNPLEAFIYKEGFARISTIPYSLDPNQVTNKFVHLTNYSIQKKNISKDEWDEVDSAYSGTKISLASLRNYFKKKGLNFDNTWRQIIEVVVKSLVACQNEINYNPWWFELYGYDIIIDDTGKWWLVEINSSPSLARDHLLDDIIKQRLIDDTIDLVEPVDFDRKRLFEVMERRITQDIKQSTSASGTNAKQYIMNRDLTYILNGAVPRAYGEEPKMMGNYEKIAPSKMSDKYIKMVGGQKMFGSLMKVNPQNNGKDDPNSNIDKDDTISIN